MYSPQNQPLPVLLSSTVFTATAQPVSSIKSSLYSSLTSALPLGCTSWPPLKDSATAPEKNPLTDDRSQDADRQTGVLRPPEPRKFVLTVLQIGEKLFFVHWHRAKNRRKLADRGFLLFYGFECGGNNATLKFRIIVAQNCVNTTSSPPFASRHELHDAGSNGSAVGDHGRSLLKFM